MADPDVTGETDGAFHAEAEDNAEGSGRGSTAATDTESGITWELGAECTPETPCVGEPCDDPDATEYWLFGTDSNGVTVHAGMTCIGDDPDISRVMISRAFRRLPMPEATLQIQPPDGRTLVNFDTNFYTHDRTLHRTVRLLGQRVDFRIWVDTYQWHYGDGQSETTTHPGAAYPALKITHNYLRTGRYRPSLDATYTADYRIDGSAWQPVDGTVTITGTPTTLRAIEATPTLVSYAD